MSKFFKIILSIFAGVILLVIVAAIALFLFINPNDFKPEIQTFVKERTGRDLNIEGELELSIFPWIGISTGSLILSNATGFSEQPFAEIKESHVKVKLVPLLSKRFEVSRIVLRGLKLNLAKNKQGINNWDDLKQTKTPDTQPETKDEPEQETVNPFASLALGGISIEQANIIWDDQQQGKYIEINDFNFKTDKLIFDQPIAIDISAHIINKDPELTESLNLSTDLVINQALNVIHFNSIKLNSMTMGQGIPNGKLQVDLQADVNVDLVKQMLTFSKLNLSSNQLIQDKLTANLQADITFNLAQKIITVTGLQVNANNLLEEKLNASLQAEVAVNLEKQTLNVAGLKLSVGNLALTAEINANQIKTDPQLNASINITSFNLAQFMHTVAMPLPKMQNPQALNQLAMVFNLQATRDSAMIQNLVLTLDDSQIKGSASIKNFTQPAVIFDIKMDAIDVNHYMPPKSKNQLSKTVASPVTATVATANLLPVETLRGLDINGQLAIAQLKIKQLNIQGIYVKLNAKKGLIKTQQSIKQFYQGAYSGYSSINVQDKTPQLAFNEKLMNVQIEPLLKDMQLEQKISGISGITSVTATLQTRGNTVTALKSSLNGTVNFNLKKSVIKGFNIQKMIDNSRVLIEGKALPTQSKNDQTVFSVIQGSANIHQGVINNQDLYAKSSKFQLKGQGTADLNTEKLNYKVDARVLKSRRPDTKEQKLKGVPIIIDITGTFSQPSYQLDVAAMIQAKYKAKINKKLDQEKDKIFKKLDEKLGPGVSDLLKSFF